MTADDLFQKMCELTAAVPLVYDPKIYSIKYLAEIMNQSRYMIQKRMKELKEAGLVCLTYEGGQDDGYVYCYHGWSLTKKPRRRNGISDRRKRKSESSRT